MKDETNTEADRDKIFHCPKQRYFQKSEEVSVEFVCLKIENEVPLTRETRKYNKTIYKEQKLAK